MRHTTSGTAHIRILGTLYQISARNQHDSSIERGKYCRTTIHIGQARRKRMKDSHKSVVVSLLKRTMIERKCKSLMARVTQDMKYRQSLMCYALKYDVSRASRKYNRPRSSIYFWLSRYDGTIESLADRSKRPHSHPNQHTEAELKLIRVCGEGIRNSD